MNDSHPFAELEELLLEWEEGSLDQQGILRLREILRKDPQARQRYVQWQMLHAAMRLEGDAGLNLRDAAAFEPDSGNKDLHDDNHSPVRDDSRPSTQGAAEDFTPRTIRPHRLLTILFAVAASLLICVLVGRWAVLESRLNLTAQPARPERPTSQDASSAVEATSEGIALVTRLVDVEWADQDSVSRVGDALKPGPLAIKSGYAQIEFFCGATVVLEGPAELQLVSSTVARCRRGRLRAQVPPAARGFEILVDDMKVVDLGTEFGINVAPGGADVQVFDGEVELHQPQQKTRLMTTGEAVVRSSVGKLDETLLTPEQFVDIESLDAHAQSQTEDRYQRWRDYSLKLRQDPRLIAYYGMDDSRRWKRKLRSSIIPANTDLDGAIVGARRVAGRWPQKTSLEFKRPGDRVRVDIPGQFASLTLACWVKIDSLDRWYNSLFLTDNYQRGEPHWQILKNGRLQFSVRVQDDESGPEHKKVEHKEVLSPVFWKPTMSGQWLHIATTYDVEKKQATHYLNGELLSQDSIPDVQLVPVTRIGKASIGNWSLPTRPDTKFAIRNLNGSIDEFALFKAALGHDEITEMYENGKP